MPYSLIFSEVYFSNCPFWTWFNE